jgi:hypothetical protein
MSVLLQGRSAGERYAFGMISPATTTAHCLRRDLPPQPRECNAWPLSADDWDTQMLFFLKHTS